MLDLIIKAQRSSMKSGAEKKSWVISQMDGGPELAAWIDFCCDDFKGTPGVLVVCGGAAGLRGSTLAR